MDWIKFASIPGAVLAVVGVWGALGFPTVATSSDVRRLDRGQAAVAVEVFDSKLRRYLAAPPPTDPVTRQIWDEEIRRSRQQLDDAEKRRIELSK